MKRLSLRVRLTIIYGGLFLVAGVVLLSTTYVLFSQQLTGSATRYLIRDARPVPSGTPSAAAPAPSASDAGRPGAGTSVAGSPAAEDAGTSGAGVPRGPTFVSVEPDDPASRWMDEERSRLREAATTSLLTQGAIALGAVGLLAVGLGWIVAGRVLGPLHQVTATARRIASAPAAGRWLHERIPLGGPDDEVRELADSINTMLDRLDRSFDGQRRFVANAGHELRTPLTVGRALVELAMKRKSASADLKRLGEDLLEINTRHERLINGLLALATSENELTERRSVDLADVAAQVLAQTPRAGVTVHEELGEAITLGDAQLLERVVHNLVENGVRYNVDDGWVRVVTRTREDGRVELEVGNTGPEVPPHEVPRLFEAFHRLPGQRQVTGAGLGLSIVRAVTTVHGGSVRAMSRDDGGLLVTVTFPEAR